MVVPGAGSARGRCGAARAAAAGMQHDFGSSEENSSRWRGLFVQALRKVLTLFGPSFTLLLMFISHLKRNEFVLMTIPTELKSRVNYDLHSCA